MIFLLKRFTVKKAYKTKKLIRTKNLPGLVFQDSKVNAEEKFFYSVLVAVVVDIFLIVSLQMTYHIILTH